MRPVHLRVEGFGVFRDPVELSFEGVDYFALVGPTGAGKSTIIDAMCFALYGSIPRYDDERLVGRVVSLGSQQAKVSLTFDVGEGHYRATRVVRLQKGRTGGDALLERLAPDGTGEVLAENRSAMKGAVERLLGLSFAHFTKCIVLPQGEFARFLHDEPSKRRDLLARLLDLDVYDRVGQLARERAKEAATAIEHESRRLDELAYATDEARALAQRNVAELQAIYKAIDEARADDDDDALAIAELDARVQASADHGRLLVAITVPTGIAAFAAEIERARDALAAATRVHTDTTAAVVAAEARVEESPEPAELLRARDAHDALAKLAARLADADANVGRATDELARTEKLLTGAQELLDDRQRALEAAQDAHRAHALRTHLVVGEPCPVCEQQVATAPKRRKPAALSKHEAALAEARAILASAHDAQRVANTADAAALATRGELVEQQSALQRAIGSYPDPAAVSAALAVAEALRTELAAARTAERAAGVSEAQARSAAQEADERAARMRQDHASQRDVLLRAGLDPPAPTTDIAADWSVLDTWCEQTRARLEAEVEETRLALEAVRRRRQTRASELGAQAHAAGVTIADPTLRALREAVFERGTEARHELVRIDEAREQAAKLREQLEAARADHDVARLLGELLRSNRFEKWMLTEALDVLIGAASITLFALSQGRYSLASNDDEEFVVVDHANADETRSVRTLSGGETFQASLALALALSDQLATLSTAGGAKLDAILLDEGFGSLDADTLDAVASTIEALGTEGRMVGVVTHVPALAERVPVRFRVVGGAVTREES
jgi:exonuclease SbcC